MGLLITASQTCEDYIVWKHLKIILYTSLIVTGTVREWK